MQLPEECPRDHKKHPGLTRKPDSSAHLADVSSDLEMLLTVVNNMCTR